jgi:hypothetical protein
MFAEPALAVAQQFVYFRVTDVVMLFFVQRWKQDVEMRQRVVNGRGCCQRQAKVPALAPFRKRLIERKLRGIDAVSKRFEEFSKHLRSAARSDYLDSDFEGQLRTDQFRPLLAIAGKRRPKDASQSNGQVRGGNVWAVVHVIFGPLGTAHQFDGIDLQQETRGAPAGGRGGIEDVGFAKCEIGGMQVRRILMKKESEIRGWMAGVCDAYKHER